MNKVERLDRWARADGAPLPLGASWIDSQRAYNFALYSRHATAVTLLCYDEANPAEPVYEYRLNHMHNKSGRVWHCRASEADIGSATLYAYKVEGPNEPWNGHRFDPEKILLDPYARRVFFPPEFRRAACIGAGPSDGRGPLGYLPLKIAEPPREGGSGPRHDSDIVIYELHVKGFTFRPNSGVSASRRGTFLGLTEKIPYLKELGVTVVELMPVHQFDPDEGNYWGYMTLNFFAPHAGYAIDDPVVEFREMVSAFHAAGIEVWLDVVFNHTSEGNELGPTYSLKGIDNSTYYLLWHEDLRYYQNDSGAGNTTRCAHPAMRELVVDSLTYWADEMNVDGFRFDLGSVFSLSADGMHNLADPPIIAEIGSMATDRNLSLVAEAWDTDTYQLGRSFPGITWGQWNGKFRDDIRSFVKGDEGLVPALIRRLYGSDDLFPDNIEDAYRPYQSINLVTAHDGLCLYDLVAYTHPQDLSWDCGWNGDLNVPAEVMSLRRRQVKNFCALQMLANGVPMIVAGDEFMNTQHGNNNPYNQDNETTWLDWDRLVLNAEVHRFYRLMIAFRKSHPSIGRSTFWRSDIDWYGVSGAPDMNPWSHTLAYCLHGASQGDDDLYVMVNAYWQELTFTVQEGEPSEWVRVVDTSLPSPEDILEPGRETKLSERQYRVGPRSLVVLRRTR